MRKMKFKLIAICQNGKNVNFDPLKNREKSKFQKSLHIVFVRPQNLSPNQSSEL